MELTHLGHAAVLVQIAGQRLLIDPGNFTDAWHRLTGLNAILITHQHPDHVDPDHIEALVTANPDAEVLAEPSVCEVLDIPRAQPLAPDSTVHIGAVIVRAVGGAHAVIHRDLPQIGNIGLLISADSEPTFFHPGDSLATVPTDVDVLAVPAYGPWAAMKETVDFVRDVNASSGFLIHDGLLNERGWSLIFSRMNAMSDTEFVDRRDQQPWVVDATTVSA